MVTPPHHHKSLLFASLALVVLLFAVGLIQPAPISLNAQWTYPSGYDPHGGYVDRLTFIVYPFENQNQALLALQSGQVYSYDEEIPFQSVVECEATPGIEVTSIPGTIFRLFSMNCSRFPTNLTGYRVALAQALDKGRIVANARGGFAQPMDAPIPLPFAYWSYDSQMASHFYDEDIVGANATLDAAHIIDTPDSPHPGWRYYDADRSGSWTTGDLRGDVDHPNGLKTEVWVQGGLGPALQACTVLVYEMEKCGLQCEIIEIGYPLETSFDRELSIACFNCEVPPPGIPTMLHDFFHSEGISNGFIFYYNSSEFDFNCTMFMEASSRLDARNWAWNCCRILMEEMPMIVCYNDENTHAYRTDIWEEYIPQVGVNRMGSNPYTYQQIRLKEEAGGPFGCYPTEYVTVLSEGLSNSNPLFIIHNLIGYPYGDTVFDLIYSRLWRVDPLDLDTNLAPDLAWNWTLESTMASGDIQEGMKYAFHLYENITWHDGTPLTAEDIRYSLMTIYPCGVETAKKVATIYRVDTPDNHTVEIYSNQTGYFTFIQATGVPIYPKHIWSPYEAQNFSWTPVTAYDFTGTGCYRWVTRVPAQYIILDRYATWHFAIEHPDRPACNPTIDGPPTPFFQLLMLIIISQVIILVVLHEQRKTRAKGAKPSKEQTTTEWREHQ